MGAFSQRACKLKGKVASLIHKNCHNITWLKRYCTCELHERLFYMLCPSMPDTGHVRYRFAFARPINHTHFRRQLGMRMLDNFKHFIALVFFEKRMPTLRHSISTICLRILFLATLYRFLLRYKLSFFVK